MTTIAITRKTMIMPISSIFIDNQASTAKAILLGATAAQQGLPAWQPFNIHSEMTPAASLAITLRAIEVGSRPALVLA